MTEFSSLGLSAIMLKSLERLDFSSATPIQAAAIPLALQGKDVLGTAQTGTGKTAAFGLPLVEHIAANPQNHTALVITPTRELAGQVQKALESFIDRAQKIKTALLIGGEPYFKQLRALEQNPAIIIGTPGRLNDHLTQGTLDLSGITYLVLDETDRMLDMGFSVQIDALLEGMDGPSSNSEAGGHKKARQTMLFSATLPPKIESLAKTYMTNPERVSMGTQSAPATDIAQETMFMAQGEKLHATLKILAEREGSAVVFVRTKYGTERFAKSLAAEGVKAEALHGDLRQRKRDNVITAFRREKFRVLVATDVAARGLDIPHVTMVINHDLPQVAEDYVHRIGRTARAGAKGEAISFVSPAEKGLWAAITRMLNPKAKGSRDDFEDRRPKGRGKKPFGKKREDWSPSDPSRKRKFDEKDDRPRKKDRHRDRDANRDKGKPKWSGKSEGTREDRAEGKPRFDRPKGQRKPWDAKPRREGSRDDGPKGEKRQWDDKPRRDRDDHPRGDKKPWGDKPRGDKPKGERKPWDGKPKGDRKEGGKPRGDKPFGERKPWGKPEGKSGGFKGKPGAPKGPRPGGIKMKKPRRPE